MKKLMMSLLALFFAFALAACGDSSGDSTDSAASTDAADDSAEAADDGAEATDDSAEATDDTAEASDDGAEAAGSVAVSLTEWAVAAETELTAGSTTFTVANDGSFTHKFGVARGDSYETLPLLDNGAIDEETLGADFLGDTENFDSGQTSEFAVDLEPGNYVLFCNIAVGPNSHAKSGQVLSVTVS